MVPGEEEVVVTVAVQRFRPTRTAEGIIPAVATVLSAAGVARYA